MQSGSKMSSLTQYPWIVVFPSLAFDLWSLPPQFCPSHLTEFHGLWLLTEWFVPCLQFISAGDTISGISQLGWCVTSWLLLFASRWKKDPSKEQQIAVVVRFWQQVHVIHERFHTFVEAKNLTSESLMVYLIFTLTKYQLDPACIVSKGYDWASAIEGGSSICHVCTLLCTESSCEECPLCL